MWRTMEGLCFYCFPVVDVGFGSFIGFVPHLLWSPWIMPWFPKNPWQTTVPYFDELALGRAHIIGQIRFKYSVYLSRNRHPMSWLNYISFTVCEGVVFLGDCSCVLAIEVILINGSTYEWDEYEQNENERRAQRKSRTTRNYSKHQRDQRWDIIDDRQTISSSPTNQKSAFRQTHNLARDDVLPSPSYPS